MALSLELPFEKEVFELLSTIEREQSEHNIRFIFVAAIGSRLQRTEHSASNVNIRGFYVGNRASYLSVVRPPKEIKIKKELKKDSPTIDFEFCDMKIYLNSASQPDKRSNDLNLWIRSDIVYLNQINTILFDEISAACSFPLSVLAGRLIQYSKTFPKLTSIKVTEMYFALTHAILAYESILHGKEKSFFPNNNVWKSIEIISESFSDQERDAAQRFGRLIKKYIQLKAEKVDEAVKEDDENEFISLVVGIVDKNKPLSKKEMDIAVKNYLPQIPVERANAIFSEIFSQHSTYKSFVKSETLTA